MSPERLDEIEARAKAATAAPWTSRPTATGMQRVLGWLDENAWRGPIEFVLATVNSWSAPGNGPVTIEAASNAEFIAHARTDVPDLLAEVRRLQSTLTSARAEMRERAAKVTEGWIGAIPKDIALSIRLLPLDPDGRKSNG